MFGILLWEASLKWLLWPRHEITTNKNIILLSPINGTSIATSAWPYWFNKFIQRSFLLNPWKLGDSQPSHISLYFTTRYCCRISLPTNYLRLCFPVLCDFPACAPWGATRGELKPLLCRGVGFTSQWFRAPASAWKKKPIRIWMKGLTRSILLPVSELLQIDDFQTLGKN